MKKTVMALVSMILVVVSVLWIYQGNPCSRVKNGTTYNVEYLRLLVRGMTEDEAKVTLLDCSGTAHTESENLVEMVVPPTEEYSSNVVSAVDMVDTWAFVCDVKEGMGVATRYCSPCAKGEIATSKGMIPACTRTCETFVDTGCSSGVGYGISYTLCDESECR